MKTEDIQNICTAFPGVKSDIKWGHDLCFTIAEKMFCVVGLDESPTSASFKVTDEEFEEMVDRPHFKPAPYVAKYKWVFIDDITKMGSNDWQHYLAQSYSLVKAKLPLRVQKQFDIK